MSPLRLLLVRHGQTLSNVEGIMDTAPPGAPLDETGRAQADRLAERLAGEDVVAVYASTAIRTQQTASPVAARHELAVIVRDGLREVDVGALEGMRGDEALAEYDAMVTQWAAGDLGVGLRGGGETAHDVLARYLATIEHVTANHSSGLVVVVSHGGAIRVAAMHLAGGLLTAEMMIEGALPNTGWVMFEAMSADAGTSTRWRCLEWTGLQVDSITQGEASDHR